MAYSQHAPVADHFAYLALIAPVSLAAAGIERFGRFRNAATVAVAIVLAGLTFARSWYFGHPEELWRITARDNPSAWTAHEHIAIACFEAGDRTAAEVGFKRSLALRPSNFRAWFNLGVMFEMRGSCAQAAGAFARAEALRPGLLAAYGRKQACRQSSP
jgi:tetratricopeptide (TPR) repeat protein